jgi:HD-GYP domain-containing protein (c-di-GMP phosphodiesterase class II)
MEAHTLGRAPARPRPSRRPGTRAPSRARRAWARVRAFEREWSVAGPSLFVALAGSLLIYNHVQQRVTEIAFWLGLALLGAVFTWLVQNNHHRARLDAVTGLPNRLQLNGDLRELFKSSAEPETLIVLELEGVTDYRDRLGFPASDQLLQGFSRELTDVVGRLGGQAYRVEGGQFCALIPSGDRDPGEIAMAIFVTGDDEDGEDETTIGRAHGVVTLPDDANDPDAALQLAGQRLAADKRHQRQSAKHQAHDALMAILNARRPEMGPHLRAVAFHAISVGRLLGMGREQLDDLVFAARLQHIGMLSVPDATIDSQSHLTAAESDLIRGLPAAGAEIIASAPALTPVAALVRSSHENYDGSGYPDGLAGDQIPLGSRILSVCVSYVVLTSKRADQRALSQDEALAELRRHAGTEFDPRVVEALAEDLTTE